MIFEHFFKNKSKMPRVSGKQRIEEVGRLPVSGDSVADILTLLKSIGNPRELVIHPMSNGQDETDATLLYLTSLASGADLAGHIVELINQLLSNQPDANLSLAQIKRTLAAAEIVEHSGLHQTVDRLLQDTPSCCCPKAQ